MARAAAVRRERNNDFSAVGKVGRRTGITLPQGRVDENGMEEMSGLFSSPRKPSPIRRQPSNLIGINENSTCEVSEDMAGLDSTGMTPTQVLSTRKSLRSSIPPPRSASPRKTGINGTARRSTGVDILTAEKGSSAIDPEDRENTAQLSPTRPAQTRRRFSPSPEKSPLREVTTNGPAPSRLAKGKQKMVHSPLAMRENHWVNGMSQHETQRERSVENIQDQAHRDYVHPEDYEDYVHPNPAKTNHEDYNTFYGGDDNEEDEQINESIEIDEEPAPPTYPTPIGINGNFVPSARKRKSSSVEEDESDWPQPVKKPRTTKQSKAKPSKKAGQDFPLDPALSSEGSQKQKKQAAGKGKGKAQKSSTSRRQQAELDEVIERVKQRPGQQKSLYILRRETPADDSATYTRSGRVSVKPLAYWRNERCVYGGSPGGPALKDGARFPLNSIKEIIRTEEVEQSRRSRSPSKARRKGHKKRHARTLSPLAEDTDSGDDSSYEDPAMDVNAEPWETETGILRGDVSVWDSSEQAPLDALEQVDIAYAPGSIITKEVKSVHPDQRTFKFAKLLSTSSFGSGIVDLAPSDLKRPKNSRKMHMSFFVARGRVTVEVGALGCELSRFSVGKGGFWQVPRGNQYSIENELDKPARIFFSQACEPSAAMAEE